MKRTVTATASLLFAILAASLTIGTAHAQDVVKLAPDVKVLLENDHVRVLESNLKPGEVEPMHSHPSMVAYFLTPTTLQITFPDGKVVERKPPAGKAIYSGPVTHEIKNIGDTLQRVLVVEIKK